MISANFPALIQGFFSERLVRQLQASPHTIASYRDTFRILLRFAQKQLDRAPSDLSIEDLDPGFIGEFLEHLERDRNNTARTRNARLAAVRSFFRYVAINEPAYALLCQRVLAMPNKRHERRTIEYLNRNEIDALLAAPDPTTWIGRRDRTLLLVAVQTGLRVSELVGLRCDDVVLATGAHVQCEGKGRKQRCTPLRPDVVSVLQAWLHERGGQPPEPLFPSRRGGHLSRDAVERLVAKHVDTAQERCPSLKRKKVTPHVLRHTAAMELLQHGVDRSIIALWLGHESLETTQMYLHADLSLKEEALSRTAAYGIKPGRFQPDDQLLGFLEAL